jgi:hypothetical protein
MTSQNDHVLLEFDVTWVYSVLLIMVEILVNSSTPLIGVLMVAMMITHLLRHHQILNSRYIQFHLNMQRSLKHKYTKGTRVTIWTSLPIIALCYLLINSCCREIQFAV